MKQSLQNTIMICILALLLCTLSGCGGKPQRNYSNVKMNPNISIPGYEKLGKVAVGFRTIKESFAFLL